MAELETDYLVVGAGASGMAFVDTLLAHSDADVVFVDRRERPGGHWLDAYPFVRLHQSSASYGVASRQLGGDRIDTEGPNAGFYERASAAEVCEHFATVMDEDFVGGGRVNFLSGSEYRGGDDNAHRVVSLTTGEETTVRVRRKVVDATYVESSIPSRHTPGFAVEPDVRFIPPNALVDLADTSGGFTVLGAGKTAMDTCVWLLEAGVDPDRIQWVRPRDAWMINRAYMQPLDLVAGFMELQANWIASAAQAENGHAFARLMETAGVFLRIDESVEPDAFRGAILSQAEVDALRSIERVVRGGRVRAINGSGLTIDSGAVACGEGETYVDCTAAGVRPTVPRPIFEPGRITLQYTTVGNVPIGAAVTGVVEALRDDDAKKNALTPVVKFSGSIADVLHMVHVGLSGTLARAAEPDINAWNDNTRLNAAAAARHHRDDPRVQAAFAAIGANLGAALDNLQKRAPLG